MNKKPITHIGNISIIEPEYIEVNISVSSACSSCHANGACTSSDSSERIIKVKNDNSNRKIGEVVNVIGTQSMGMSAVFYAYVLPFIIILSTLLVLTEGLAMPELKAGIIALLILPPYYIGLYLFRDRLEKKYIFRIQ